MNFATISTHHTQPQPALVSNGRVYPLPFADMHEVISIGADEAARRASKESFAVDEVKFYAPLKPYHPARCLRLRTACKDRQPKSRT
ncbi:MAG: hypothetical protein IPN96_17925 [Anaerolineales bacterium]|nr:hypothetical protein [Anaerolineales bacterium]